mmetsp:Transcript_113980/g.322374  ORF Transcript_113980/g.322374 Transcript_113980/m.322374 type:complete len:264 (-) Transcript_113980:24-815(-)
MIVFEVVQHTGLVSVAAHEKYLEVWVFCPVGLVELLELRCEATAGGTPVSAEVQSQRLTINRFPAHHAPVLLEEGFPKGFSQGRRLPGKAGAVLEVVHDFVSPLLRNDFAFSPQDDQRRDSLDLVLFAQRFLCVAILEGQRQPGLLSVVLIEGTLVTVTGHEDGLEVLGRRVLRVKLRKLRSEPTARRAPVGREVDEYGGLACKRLFCGDFSCLAHKLFAKERLESRHCLIWLAGNNRPALGTVADGPRETIRVRKTKGNETA